MVVPTPEFGAAKRGRKGYERAAVDAFVERVLERVNTDRSPDGMSSHELAMPLFDEARGAAAYDEPSVDEWLKDMRKRIQELESTVREEDIANPGREGSVQEMAAPQHFDDRFPRVSRSVLGFAADEVNDAMDNLRASLNTSQAPSPEQILGLSFTEEHGGYRQVAVAEALELIALARRAR
ncbi:hypothetical protein [Cumulibacter soli]|uniref:hypothetical protein n=1 Tax=Cumulibacter soli TaxID=2546344 RepID=UPI00106804F9|nr:hypothetical protein [Cumulibacter soli]